MDTASLRELVRLIISEGPAGSSVSADPTDKRGFYDYELDMRDDVLYPWYRSPARPAGQDGDPGRPPDAPEFLGMKNAELNNSNEGN